MQFASFSVTRFSADGHTHEDENLIRVLSMYLRQFAVLSSPVVLSEKSPIILMQRKYIVGIAITKNIRYPTICLCRFAIFVLYKNVRGWLSRDSKDTCTRVSVIIRFLGSCSLQRRDTERLPAVYPTRRVELTTYIFRELSHSNDTDKIPHTRKAILPYDYPQKSFRSRSGILLPVLTRHDSWRCLIKYTTNFSVPGAFTLHLAGTHYVITFFFVTVEVNVQMSDTNKTGIYLWYRMCIHALNMYVYFMLKV